MAKVTMSETDLKSKLDALQGPEWESSDEESVDKEPVKTKSKDDKYKKSSRSIQRKASSKKRSEDAAANATSVLYIGHLPPHFEEHELVQFLKQFGKVLNLRVSRSKTTGNSKGFAFVQMQSAGIAAIVADTLAGYIMFGQRRLVCHVVPPDKIHKKLFFRQKRIVKKAPVTEKALGKMKEITSRLVARDRKKRDTLKALGIDYDFPGYVASKKEEKEVAPTKKSAKSTRSTESPDNKQPKKKQRKDSVASVESPATSDSKKGKKRKESLTSVVAAEKTDKEAEAVQKSTRSNSPKSTENKQPKKKMRKDSDEAVVDAKKQESKSKIKSPPAAKGKAAKPAAAQSEKKKAVSKPRTRRSL